MTESHDLHTEFGLVGCLRALPDTLLAHVCSDLSTVGCCAAVCKDLRTAVWDSDDFWHALRGAAGASPAREAYRLARFNLEGDWISRFGEFALTADPAAVLREGAYIAGGLCLSDGHGAAFVASLCACVRRAEPTDELWDALDALDAKVASSVLRGAELACARADLLEQAVVAQLDAVMDEEMDVHFEFEVNWDTYEQWVVDGPLPALLLGPIDVPAPPSKGFSEEDLWRFFDDDKAQVECDDLDLDDLDWDDFFSVDGDAAELSKELAALQEDFLECLHSGDGDSV